MNKIENPIICKQLNIMGTDVTYELYADGSEWYRDSLGGLHNDGVGWSPDGKCCGECGNLSCVGCKIAKQ